MLSYRQNDSSSLKRPPSRKVFIALCIGLVWLLLQFGTSEILYRISLSTPEDEPAEALMLASDFISWPAVRYYQKAEATLYLDELNKIVSAPSTYDSTVIEKSKELIDLHKTSKDEEVFLYESWEWLEQNEIEVYLSTDTEYQIYLGTCAIWGGCVMAVSYLLLSIIPAKNPVSQR